MNAAQIRDILSHVKFRDWNIVVVDRRSYMYLQVVFKAPCAETGATEIQHGRKWLLSTHMTTSEVVATAFKAVMTAVEHEAREDFYYKKVRVFGPHIHVEAVVELNENLPLDVREKQDGE